MAVLSGVATWECPSRECPVGTLSTGAGCAGGPARSGAEASVMGVERRGRSFVVVVRSVNQSSFWEEPDLEPHVLRGLFPASGDGGGDPQAAWEGNAGFRGAHRRGSGGADGRGRVPGAAGGTGVPLRLLRYRPGRSALQAVGTCRTRCWKYDWVIDLDIRKFLDSVRWDLVVKAVEAHTDARWMVLYVQRWLAAPL